MKLLPIEAGCKALYLYMERTEVTCINQINDFSWTDKYGYKYNWVAPKNDILWLLDTDVFSSKYEGSGENIYLPVAIESDLMRIDGNEELFKQEQREKVKL